MISLTEGRVCITHTTTTPGCYVHTSQKGGFLTLYAVPVRATTDAVIVNENATARTPDVHFLVYIGRSSLPLRLTYRPSEPRILQNAPIWAGEEVWVACSQTDQFVVYGHEGKVV